MSIIGQKLFPKDFQSSIGMGFSLFSKLKQSNLALSKA